MDRTVLAQRLVGLARARGVWLATAESCTGGLVAAAITAVPGASDVFGHGFVTYSNAAKSELLGVPAGLIAAVGAVSEAVARRMAIGGLRRSGAGLCLAVTGIAGPGGGSVEKPVGTVWFGLATPAGAAAIARRFRGDRDAIRAASTEFALQLFLEAMAA